MDPRPKVIDHLIVLGVNTDKDKITAKNIQENTVTPSLLEIYPTPEGKDKIPKYLENCSLWGFENGFKLYDENFQVIYGKDDKFKPRTTHDDKRNSTKGIEAKNSLYSFVMTDEHYCKRYCTSLLFHEPYYLQNEENNEIIIREPNTGSSDGSAKHRQSVQISENVLIYVPKSVSLVSSKACFDTQRMILKYIYGNLLGKNEKEYLTNKIRIPTRYIWNLSCLVKDIQENNLQGDEGNIDKQWDKICEYNRDIHLKAQGKEEEIFVQESQLKEFYFSAIFSVLEFPKKPADKIVLKLYDQDQNNEMIRFRTIKKSGIYLPEITYKVLLKRLSARNIVRIFKYILLEKQIIFFSSRTEELPYVTEAFLSLISPLSWCCLYVPFLPIIMWEILHAVMPYIVGVSSKYKEFVANQIDLTDKIVVDLDDDALFIGEDTCEFPKEAQNYLVKELEQIKAVSSKAHPKKSRHIWVELTLKTRHIFNVGLLTIINNYLGHYQINKGKSENLFKNAASEVFQLEQYLKIFPNQSAYFMRELSATMMFINLVEESYRLIYTDKNSQSMPDPVNVDEIVTFIEQVKAMRFSSPNVTNFNHALTAYINILTPEALQQMEFFNSESIEQTKNRYNNPETVDLFPYLVKYYFRFFLNQKDRLKLVSSPLTFKNSSGIKSPESDKYNNTSDLLNSQIRYFEPLSRSKLVDLHQVFASGPKPPPPQKLSIEPPVKNSNITISRPPVPDPTTQATTNGHGTSQRGSFGNQERRYSVENGPKQISFQIDRNQFNKIGDLSMPVNKMSTSGGSRYYSIPSDISPGGSHQRSGHSLPGPGTSHGNIHHQPTRSSMPPNYSTQSSLNTHDVHQKQPIVMHHQTSLPTSTHEIQGYAQPMHSSLGNPRGKNNNTSRGDVSFSGGKSFKDEDGSVLYNVLHIPRKQSDTNYRLFGRAGLDESRISGKSFQHLEHDSIHNNVSFSGGKNLHVTKTEEVLGYKYKSAGGESVLLEGDLIPSQLKGEGTTKSPLDNQRRKIFEKKEVYITPFTDKIWEERRVIGGGAIKIEDSFVERNGAGGDRASDFQKYRAIENARKDKVPEQFIMRAISSREEMCKVHPEKRSQAFYIDGNGGLKFDGY